MELVIPLLALGGLFVISNQNKNPEPTPYRENFSNIKSSTKTEKLPNTSDSIVQNYPVLNKKELVDTTHKYSSPNTVTDKYFNQSLYQQQHQQNNGGNTIQQVYSLTGNYIAPSSFEHNNMVPFFGSKVKGQVYNDTMAESILDNMTGSGSQTIKRVEQAPLFKPEDNVQWAFGAPNMSDFYQSRVNPAMMNSMAKPFESERVGPALNKGFSNDGSNGFNSGMEARELWLPKTVDDLRVLTNPKMEYDLTNHQGPSHSQVQNLGSIGKVEKHTPDTFYIQSQDRWLTTTGQEKGETLRPVQEVPETSRSLHSIAYTGTPTGQQEQATYAPANYEQSKRVEVKNNVYIAHSNAQGKGTHLDKDNAHKSHLAHTSYSTNRSMLKQPDTIRSGFSGSIGAVVAPLLDIFRPSKKEEHGSNIHIYTNAGTTVPENYVLNPNDSTSTTIKETTMYSPNANIQRQVNGGYTVNKQQPAFVQRDTTNYSAVGIAGGSASTTGNMNYNAAYGQINNDTKEISVVSRTNHGNTQIFNQTMNLSSGSKVDADRNNNRMFVPTSMPQQTANKELYGRNSMQNNMSNNKNIHNLGVERNSPDILNAFRSNPYTQSLTDCV
jgi:hypothetical protein